MRFVPPHYPPDSILVERLIDILSLSKRITVLTGAGLSTESGLPDYRSAEVGLYARSNRRPIEYKDFIQNESARQRYWARNFAGWPYFSQVLPNEGHFILSDWFSKDKLHQAAGNKDVLELHGNSHSVICLQCGHREPREALQSRFIELNSNWKNLGSSVNIETVAPDGDFELPENPIHNFKIPNCSCCGTGILKPDVVFFGENLPTERKKRAASLVAHSDLLLCLGTTLQTYSSFRLAIQAKNQNIYLAIVNIGSTRADSIANLIINARINEILTKIHETLK